MGRANRRGDGGVALLLVIWVLALLALLAAHLTVEARGALDGARTTIEISRARVLAESGVWAAVAALLDGDRWTAVPLDGTPHRFAALGERVVVTVVDERGKFDLNVSGETALRMLIENIGGDPMRSSALARNVTDYRAAAEARDRGVPVPAPGKLFVLREQLCLVPGFDDALCRLLLPFVTVYTESWGINPAVASPVVLSSLPGVEPSAVQRFVRLRERLRGDPVSLRLAAPPEIARQAVWGRPDVVTITATAHLDTGAEFVREAVVELAPEEERPFRVLAWTMPR